MKAVGSESAGVGPTMKTSYSSQTRARARVTAFCHPTAWPPPELRARVAKCPESRCLRSLYRLVRSAVPRRPSHELLAENVRRIAQAKGVSFVFLAGIAGISTERLPAIFSGEFDPVLDVLNKLADGLGVALSDLLPTPTVYSGPMTVPAHFQPTVAATRARTCSRRGRRAVC
jgi:hypothetical protein